MLKPLSKRQRAKRLEEIGRPDGHVRGYHGMCPNREPKWATGSSYDALFLDEYDRICCKECGAVDLEPKKALAKSGPRRPTFFSGDVTDHAD